MSRAVVGIAGTGQPSLEDKRARLVAMDGAGLVVDHPVAFPQDIAAQFERRLRLRRPHSRHDRASAPLSLARLHDRYVIRPCQLVPHEARCYRVVPLCLS